MHSSNIYLINGAVGIVVILALSAFLFLSRLNKSEFWRVVVTPLASIIGSGFLIVAHLMYTDFGFWSVPFVLLLNAFAMGIGWAIRVNIADFDPHQDEYAEKKR